MLGAVSVTEHAFSDLLRTPKVVLDDLEDGDVVLRRRGAAPLRLSPWERDVERSDAFAAVIRLLRHLARHNAGAMRAAACEAFPWSDFLPNDVRDAFVTDLTRVLAAGAELDTFHPVSRALAEWRATAAVYADPELASRLAEPIETTEDRPVAEPGG